MARRIKFTGWTPYMTARIRVAGYRPTASSRFAVARIDRNQSYQLIHVRSGMPVESLLPALGRPIVMTEKLAVAAAFEALTHCDWAVFDDLQELGESFNGRQHLDTSKPGAMATVAEMRRVTAEVFA